MAVITAACANPNLPPVDEPNRNITVGAIGAAGAIVTCQDGTQQGARGVGLGLILTDCPTMRAEPRDSVGTLPTEGSRWGIASIGAGLGVTVAKCPEFSGIVSFGLGLGVAVFACPKQPK